MLHAVHSFLTWIIYVVELAFPFAVLFGRWGRVTAAIGFTVLMTGILFTGNYTYFNWLSLLLCIPLIPDRA